jgi:hypothetical protein
VCSNESGAPTTNRREQQPGETPVGGCEGGEMAIDLRVVIEAIVGLLLSGLVSLAIHAINAKVNQRYLELKLELSENYVSKKSLEALIARLERSIAKLEEQVDLADKLDSGFAGLRSAMSKRDSATGTPHA